MKWIVIAVSFHEKKMAYNIWNIIRFPKNLRVFADIMPIKYVIFAPKWKIITNNTFDS